MVSGPVQIFTRFHKKNITRTRSQVYGEENKFTENVIGYDAIYHIFTDQVKKFSRVNTRWLYMRRHLIKSELQNLNGETFGFDIPNKLCGKFSETEQLLLKRHTIDTRRNEDA